MQATPGEKTQIQLGLASSRLRAGAEGQDAHSRREERESWPIDEA
jgi:hypothetical protein